MEAVLEANTKGFEQGMDRSEGRMHSVRKTAGIAGAAIVGGLAVGLEKSVHAAMDAQVSQSRLEIAFRTAGLSANKYRGHVDELEKSGRKLGFTDEQTKNALGSLLVATHSMTSATNNLGVAQDIARFKHIDLIQATKMLTMAQAGSQRATKQLGISVQQDTSQQDELKIKYQSLTAAQKKATEGTYKHDLALAKVIDKQKTASIVIQTVKAKLDGQAAAYSKTAAGGMEQFHAQLDHLEVKAGEGLLPVLVKLTGKLSDLMNFFSEHTTTAKVFAAAIATIGGALIGVSIAEKAVAAATKLWTAAQWLLNIALDANPIGIVILALTALGIGLVIAWKKSETFRAIVTGAWNAIKESAIAVKDWITNTFLPFFTVTIPAAFQSVKNWLVNHWELIGLLAGPLGLAVTEIIKHRDRIVAIFTNLPGQIANALGDLKQFFFHNIIDKFTGAIDDGVKAVKNAITSLFNKVVDWALHALGIRSPSTVFYGIGQNAIQGFIDGVGSMAGKLKDAVVHVASHYLSEIGGGVTGAIGAIPGAKGTIVGEGKKSGVHASPSLAKQFAVNEMKAFGWGPSQMAALEPLWNGESGWRWNALNSSSGAYGIPQSLPASKMASAGSDWHENAFTQIMWGLRYIKDRYGSPSSAYSAWQHRSPHWYDRGGWLPTGLSLAMNNTGRPERVLGPGEGGGITINYNGTIIHEREAEQRIVDLLVRAQRRGPLGLAGT